ncbi:hypothetical protein B0A52_04743 [Exophiala mesophila]|uniref:Enoyl reductase (ER) domain-containing protein n=1 Tax=Exophiala mesophila TaxID=212818 RepID=A0A438N8S0_EXOME|nr:hypothetical protein B0A52_04743 [Exophiala mesophila]
MKAVVIREPGGPEVLKVESIPIPVPGRHQVLIKVKAFGLNRSEMFTRQGYSPSVKFPRVLGIEAVGIVEQCPSGRFEKGDQVATCMGGMGRDFDGGYAQYTCVHIDQVQVFESSLDWAILGALPEMLQTAWGSLFSALKLKHDDTLLIRGGTSSVGLAAAALARNHGAHVAATTRSNSERSHALLRRAGAEKIIIDDGNVADQVKDELFTKVLELVGTTTLKDSLKCAADSGVVCMAGILGNEWELNRFNPMEAIPNGVCLTKYSGSPETFMRMPLHDMIKQVQHGQLPLQLGQTFRMDDIALAHETMEKNLAYGKIVVLTE